MNQRLLLGRPFFSNGSNAEARKTLSRSLPEADAQAQTTKRQHLISVTRRVSKT